MGHLLEHRLDGYRRWWARGLATLGLVGGLGAPLAACGGGSSVSSSPGTVVTDLFHAIEANNCNQSYALLSTSLQNQLGGKDKTCALVSQLSVRYAGNAIRIDSVTTSGNHATVSATRTSPNGTRVSAVLGTVVDSNSWKVNSLNGPPPGSSSNGR